MSFVMSDDEIRAKLTAEEYRTMREGGVEDPYTGDFLYTGLVGTFRCKLCNQPLFETTAQFYAMTGWPSFDKPIDGAVEEYESKWFEKPAIGVRCANCKSHVGHKFDRGITELNTRYSINSVAITLDESLVPTPRAPRPPADTEETSAEVTTPA